MMDPAVVPDGLERALDELVFSKWDREFLKTPEGVRGKQDVLVNRYFMAHRFSIPWLRHSIALESSRILEVGCGTGSSTAALAGVSRHVTGFDIDGDSVKAAIARCQAYGRANVELHQVAPEELLTNVRARAGEVDVFVLYAVLEHLTYPERLETLSTLWGLLPEGGHLVIVETPNRFVYIDKHTSEQEFYHLLPDELAFAWLDRVPRLGFKLAMQEPLRTDRAAASETRIRWGLGASYHEIELGIGEPSEEIIVADGFEREMVDWFPVDLDEDVLTRFFVQRPVDKPIGFSRAVLNLVLRKPASRLDRDRARTFNRGRREEIARRYEARFVPPPPPPPLEPPAPSLREVAGVARRWAESKWRQVRERL